MWRFAVKYSFYMFRRCIALIDLIRSELANNQAEGGQAGDPDCKNAGKEATELAARCRRNKTIENEVTSNEPCNCM